MNFFWRNLLWVVSATGFMILLAAVAAVANSLPPRELTILTGREDGTYYETALAYQAIAAEYGFTLNIRPTAGSVETLELLESGAAEAGFVQGGVARDGDPDKLSTLASLFYEPLWILYRKELAPDRPLEALPQLEGMRVGIGEAGSGTNQLTRMLLTETGVMADTTTFVEEPLEAMAEDLQSGDLDVAFFVLAPDNEIVRELIRDPELQIMSMRRAGALARRHQFLNELTIPEGTIDLVSDMPPVDVELVAPVANLIVSNELHPDLLRLLTIAAVRTHEAGGIFEEPYEFPNALHADLPVGREELAYLNRIRSGESPFDHFLPFWAAALIDRYILFVVPIALLLVPLLNRSPLFYSYLIRNQINKWYRALRDIEVQIDTMEHQDIDGAIATLDQLDARLARELRVTNNYMPDVYNLRSHIRVVIERLEWRKAHPLDAAQLSQSAQKKQSAAKEESNHELSQAALWEAGAAPQEADATDTGAGNR